MKWIAYAKVYADGYNYFYSFPFELPEDLYDELVETTDHKAPVESCPNYEKIIPYAKMCVDYALLTGYGEHLEDRNESFSDWDYYDCVLTEYNSYRKRIAEYGDIIYIRLFDPEAYRALVDHCLDLPHDENLVGKKKVFYADFEDEHYEWSIVYNKDDYYVTEIKSSIDGDNNKFLSGKNSVFPPYEEIFTMLNNNEVTCVIKDQ